MHRGCVIQRSLTLISSGGATIASEPLVQPGHRCGRRSPLTLAAPGVHAGGSLRSSGFSPRDAFSALSMTVRLRCDVPVMDAPYSNAMVARTWSTMHLDVPLRMAHI